ERRLSQWPGQYLAKVRQATEQTWNSIGCQKALTSMINVLEAYQPGSDTTFIEQARQTARGATRLALISEARRTMLAALVELRDEWANLMGQADGLKESRKGGTAHEGINKPLPTAQQWDEIISFLQQE